MKRVEAKCGGWVGQREGVRGPAQGGDVMAVQHVGEHVAEQLKLALEQKRNLAVCDAREELLRWRRRLLGHLSAHLSGLKLSHLWVEAGKGGAEIIYRCE